MVRFRMGTLRIVAIAVALAVVFGCGGGGTGTVRPPDPAVAFINASPDSPALDALLNNFQLANNVAYLSSSPRSGAVTTFATIEPNDYDINVFPDGDPANGSLTTAVMNRDTSILTVAVGLTDPLADFEKRLQAATFTFDRQRPNGDKARLIIVNGFIGSPGFDSPAVDFRNPGDNALVNVANLAFGASGSALIDSGSQSFVARLTGTDSDAGNVTPAATLDFVAGKIYAAIISGVEGEAGAMSPRITFLEIQPK